MLPGVASPESSYPFGTPLPTQCPTRDWARCWWPQCTDLGHRDLAVACQQPVLQSPDSSEKHVRREVQGFGQL